MGLWATLLIRTVKIKETFEFYKYSLVYTEKKCVNEFWGLKSQECLLSSLRGHGEDSKLPDKLVS